MKILRVKVDGFRSLRSSQKVDLKNGRSMYLLADNGRGKSSLVDALEYWSAGDVGWVHRDGVGIGSLVHLAEDQAIVEVATDSGVASRRLGKTGPHELEVGQGVMPAGSALEPIPMLRHRTMSDFVDKTANDKRTELLMMLGLTELVPFRLGLRSAARRSRADVRIATEAAEATRSALDQALGGLAPDAKVTSLAAKAGVALSSAADLIAFSGDVDDSLRAATHLARIEELVAATQAARVSSVDRWNLAVRDQKVASEQGLSVLLAAGQKLLTSWDDESCPLCLVAQSRDELARQVHARALDLADADRQFAVIAAQADEREQVVLRLGTALRAVVDDERNASWSYLDAASEVLAALRSDVRAIKEARSSRSALNTEVMTLADAALDALRAGSQRTPADSSQALLELVQLRGRLLADRRASSHLRSIRAVESAIGRAAELGDIAVRRAIDIALDGLNGLIGSFYTKLLGDSPYGDVQLHYQEARAGGIEFSFVWNGATDVSPPQRVMSESQLGALGLAVFLARLKARPPRWRTLVLDDVVTSFDVVHRTNLVRLLAAEFSEWQIILCTHDQQLARVIDDETTGWREVKVASWTPMGGTIFGDARPRDRLRQLLREGQAADELGGLARQSMEQALERPVRKLRLRIRHDPSNRYTADEYRRALLEGLRDGRYVHAEHPVLQRLATASSVTNRACHFKEREAGVTSADLQSLLEDLATLDALFVCEDCKRAAWDFQDTRTARCQCPCGKLSCA